MMTGAGPSYREIQRGRIQCKEYGEEIALRFLVVHLKTQHGMVEEGRRHWEATDPSEELRMYRISFLTAGGARNCPVEGCPGRAATSMAMRVHFFHRNVQDTVIILEEGNLPHPLCPRCDILVPWSSLIGRHLSTTQFAKGAERK